MYQKLIIILVLLLTLTSCVKSSSSTYQGINQESKKLYEIGKEVYDKHINHYFYDLYDEESKFVYDYIYQEFLNHHEQLLFDTSLSQKEIEAIYIQVIYDHPEMFYVVPRIKENEGIYTVSYFYNEEEISSLQNQIDQITKQYLETIKDKNIVEIVDSTYAFMFPRIKYDHEAYNTVGFNLYTHYDDYNIIKSLTEGLCVCTGYASTFQYLLNQAGYQCLLVQGTSHGNAHSFVALELDDQFYYFDPTWDDNSKDVPMTFYMNYGLSYQQADVLRNFANCQFENATSEAFNYANVHGYYIENKDLTQTIIDLQKNNEITMIKYDEETYLKVKEEFYSMKEFQDIGTYRLRMDDHMHCFYYSNVQEY